MKKQLAPAAGNYGAGWQQELLLNCRAAVATGVCLDRRLPIQAKNILSARSATPAKLHTGSKDLQQEFFMSSVNPL
ncbi:MAG: hypothetical protein CVU57_12740 [Deltaproteobacteria bacterium HGW-Deltaproteobacteria-15]|jgi:hypothetical protein|nr:MAG: hypothetical protein CVU57_12740 [Deltaproteobacteria bacterium HGW-Deltaproteobacteria-15]